MQENGVSFDYPWDWVCYIPHTDNLTVIYFFTYRYCPSIFTLEPGDLVHINKGRLHAFRKMSTSKLPGSDCHAERRRKIIESKGIAGEEIQCVSVAWDWMYRGVTPAGINREISAVLGGSTLLRKHALLKKPGDMELLAIPELCLLQMAKCIPPLGALETKERKGNIYNTTKGGICKGMLPGLCVVVDKHIRASDVKESKSKKFGGHLLIASTPDSRRDPQTNPLDPYGSDYTCKICGGELSNVYFHCDGCERLLGKDFNICRGCHLKERFRVGFMMHPSDNKRHARFNHTGKWLTKIKYGCYVFC